MRAERGFTLLEVLIANVIAALALGALYQTAVSGVRSMRTAARYNDALSRARSHLDMAVHGGTLAPSDSQGDDGGGFHWRLHIEPVAQTGLRPDGPSSGTAQPLLALYRVTVWNFWDGDGSRHAVQLDT
ncbi:MAG TPA: prepilin-type N-terminal cleavage/methylation domain-containing protein [Acetobacteraceae bacterium]|nr:prepilin-type N-terminal cleavage/methylation domain-containing protein [Acetobacteraceae bacterium]